MPDGGHAAGGTDGKVGGLINESSDLDQVEEDSGVNGAGPQGVVVRICDSLEYLWRQLEPWPMERRYVPPMPMGRRRQSLPARDKAEYGGGDGSIKKKKMRGSSCRQGCDRPSARTAMNCFGMANWMGKGRGSCGIEAHLFLQITSTCCEGGGSGGGGAFVFVGFFSAGDDMVVGGDDDCVVGDSEPPLTCSPFSPGADFFFLGMLGS